MRPALKQLLQAEAKGKATLEQGLSKEDLELLRNTFDANMTDVMAVAKETSPDAEALAEQTKDAAYLYAVSLTAAGRSPHNAAKLAVNKFIKDHTTYTDTFAIPNDYDAGAVEAYTKAELAKHEGDLDAFAWRNTDDGTGLKLVTPDGEPILDSDGKPIRKTFEEMQREGQALPEDRQGPSGLDEEITDNAVRATSVDVDGLSDYGEDEPNPSAPEPSGDSDDASEYGGASTKGQQDPSDIDEDVSNPGAAGEGSQEPSGVDEDDPGDYGEDEPNPSAPAPSEDSDDGSDYGEHELAEQLDPSDLGEKTPNSDISKLQVDKARDDGETKTANSLSELSRNEQVQMLKGFTTLSKEEWNRTKVWLRTMSVAEQNKVWAEAGITGSDLTWRIEKPNKDALGKAQEKYEDETPWYAYLRDRVKTGTLRHQAGLDVKNMLAAVKVLEGFKSVQNGSTTKRDLTGDGQPLTVRQRYMLLYTNRQKAVSSRTTNCSDVAPHASVHGLAMPCPAFRIQKNRRCNHQDGNRLSHLVPLLSLNPATDRVLD
jgi:hypothetical protein